MRRRSEGGSALIPALCVLSLLTLLSTLALLAGGADLLLSTRLSRERAAFYAAESALASAIEELSAGAGPLPEAAFHAPWPRPEIPVRRWRDGPWECSRRCALLPDLRNADADPATTAVLFNRSFGYAGSPRERGGFPVVQVLVTASSGGSRQAIVAELAAITVAPCAAAAWTAAGPLELSGGIGFGGAPPAIASRGAVLLRDGATAAGGILTDPDLALPPDLPGVLNAGRSLPRLEDLPRPSPDRGPSGICWSRGDYAGALDGEGILVVHNPSFDPVRHEASRLALEEGLFTTAHDPAYSHLDPARQPARLEIVRGGTFRGVIIADCVGAAAAAFEITGALITLSRSPQRVQGAAPLLITHSPEVVAAAGRGPLRLLTAFRPLPATAGRLQ